MSFDPHANFAYATVDTAPSPAVSGTSLTLVTSAGALLFPDPGAQGYNVTIWPTGELPLSTNAEIVRVTAMVGLVLTITRAQEGTSARTILAGDQIAVTITKKVVTDVENAIPSTAGLISAVNVSAGATSNNLSALTFSNSNGVSFGLTGSVVTATVATNYQSQGAYLTTAALSQDSSNYAGTNGAITGGSITVNTAGVSVNLPAYLTTAMQSNAVTLSNIKVSAGTISTLRSDLTFSNSNGVSFGLETNGVVTATVATNYQSAGAYLTTARASSDAIGLNTAGTRITWTANSSGLSIDAGGYAGTGFTTTTVAGDVVAGTQNTAGLKLAVPAYLTTSPAQSDQTVGLYASSNTNLTSSGTADARSLSFRAVGPLSIGYSGGELVFSNVAQSAGAYLTTAALSQDSSKYAGTGFTSAGANVGLSGTQNTAGLSLSVTVAAQSVQTQNLVAVSLSGNTAGVLALGSSGTVIFAGGNNITLSQNGQSITISGPNAGGAQTGISGIVVSDTTYTSGTVSFSNAGNITIASSVNGATQYIKLSGNAAQTNQSAIKGFGVSDTGATAGNTGISTGIDWVMAGSNLLTLSQSTAGGGPNTVWIQHPSWLTTAALSQDSSKYVGTGFTSAGANVGISGTNNTAGLSLSVTVAAQTNQSAIKGFGVSNTGATAGNTGISTGIDWVMAGSNLLTLSQSTAGGGPNTVWIQHPAWLTTAMASNRGSDFVQAAAVFNGTNATGTIASGAISVSVAAPIPIATTVNSVASANSVGTVTRYAAEDHRHAGVGGIGISTSGNTAGTTGSVLGTYWIQGGNSLTVSQITSNNGSHTLVLSVGNYITTAMASNRGSDFVQATAGFNGTNASGTIASNSISVSVAAPIPIATIVYDVASANSTGTVTRYAPEDHRHAGIGALGISTSGNTAGTTGSVQGTYWFQGGANLTVSQITSNNGSHTLVLSAGTAAPSPVNFSAGTTSSNLGSVVFSNSNGVSFGLSGSTITGTVATFDTVGTATTVYSIATANSVGTVTRWAAEDHRHAVPPASQYAPEWGFSGKATNSSLGQSTVYFEPFDLPYYLSASRINFYLSLSGAMSAGNSTGTCSAGIGYGIYTLATGADSQTLSLLTSYSLQLYSISFTSNTAFRATHYAGLSNATSHTTVQTAISNANATTYQATNMNGPRVVAMPLGITMTPGRYYLGMSVQTVTGNALTNNVSVMQTSVGVQPAVYPIGSASAASNASVFGPQQGWGFYSAQTGAFPNTIPFTTDAIRRAVAAQTLVPFEIVGYATSTNII